MNKSIFLSGLVVSAIVAIVPAVSAQSIVNGDYGDVSGSGHVVQVRNNKFRFLIDQPDPPTSWRSVSKAGFKSIKSSVFFDASDRTYYCLIKKQMKSVARCTRNGWR
jgi:hypothetical protein